MHKQYRLMEQLSALGRYDIIRPRLAREGLLRYIVAA